MDERIMSLIAYTVSSAIGCIKEPKIYGPLRLIESTEKIIDLFSELKLIQSDELLEILKIIKDNKLICMSDEEKFEEMLNDVLLRMISVVD